jgi:flagellar hook-length control protein FliK
VNALNIINVRQDLMSNAIKSKPTDVKGGKGFYAMMEFAMAQIPMEKAGKIELAEGVQHATVDGRELRELLAQFFESVPTAEGFLQQEMLTNEAALDGFRSLPAELQTELHALFEAGLPLEELIAPQEEVKKDTQMFAILFVLKDLKQNQQIPSRSEAEKIVSLISQELKTGNDQLIPALKALIGQISSGSESPSKLPFIKKQYEPLMPYTVVQNSAALNKITKALSESGMENKDIRSLVSMIADTLKTAKTDQQAKAVSDVIAEQKSINPILFEKITTALAQQLETLKLERSDNISESLRLLANEDERTVKGLEGFGTLTPKMPISKAEQYVIHVNPSGNNTGADQQFMKQFQNIMKNSLFEKQSGSQQLLIRLHPEHLGSLTVKLTQANGEMVARLFATSAAAKDLIEGNLHQLKSVLSSQNITLDKIEVNIQNDAERDLFDQKNNDGRGQKQEKQQQTEQTVDEEDTFLKSFEEELLNITI